VGARVVCCPAEQFLTLKVVPNLLGYMIIVSYFIVHKITSEVNTLTKDYRTLKLAAKF
jgi:hypothetical protein